MALTEFQPRRQADRFDGELSIDHAVRFTERNWLVLLATPLLLALGAFVLVGFILPAAYVSGATLVVAQPPVSSTLQPQALSVHGYKTILESGAVISATQQKLAELGMLDPQDNLELGKDLEARIFVSRREETTSLAPMLELRGRAEDPERAAALANTWANVFLAQVKEMVQRATRVAIGVVEAQYPKTQSELREREGEWVKLSNEFEDRYHEAATQGDRRAAAFEKDTTDQISAHRAESRSTIEGIFHRGPEEDLLPWLASVEQGIVERLAELTSLRAQMAQTTSLLVLEKTITDDALWQSLVQEKPTNLFLSRGLLSQETNPVFEELALETIRIEGELKRSAGAYREQASELAREIENLQRNRSVGLAKLQAERSLGLTVLRRQTKSQLDAIDRERNSRLEQIDREIQQLTLLENKLSGDYSEAILARAQEDVEFVYLAAPAVALPTPEDRGLLLKTFSALIFGAVLGLVLAVVREVHRRRRPRSDQA